MREVKAKIRLQWAEWVGGRKNKEELFSFNKCDEEELSASKKDLCCYFVKLINSYAHLFNIQQTFSDNHCVLSTVSGADTVHTTAFMEYTMQALQ